MFAPGLGGNHIANLLSTSNEFLNRFSSHDYNTSEPNAHFFNITNIELEDISDNIDILSTQNNILCGHWASYYWLMQSDLSKHFNNRQILIIEPPSYGTMAYERLIKHVTAYTNHYFYEEMKLLYTIETMQKMFDDDDFFVLNADVIFQNSINTFIEKAEEEFCIKLNSTLCKTIHDKWFVNRLKETNVKTN